LHARQSPNGVLGTLADRLPASNICGIDRNRKKHFAIADHHIRQHIGGRQRQPIGARHFRKTVENLLFGRRHSMSPNIAIAPPP
jgi:hypothetical protein